MLRNGRSGGSCSCPSQRRRCRRSRSVKWSKTCQCMVEERPIQACIVISKASPAPPSAQKDTYRAGRHNEGVENKHSRHRDSLASPQNRPRGCWGRPGRVRSALARAAGCGRDKRILASPTILRGSGPGVFVYVWVWEDRAIVSSKSRQQLEVGI